MATLAFLALKAANWLIMCHSDYVFFEYHTDKAKNHWCTLDAHFQDVSMSVSLSSLHTKTANIITLEECDYAAICLLRM